MSSGNLNTSAASVLITTAESEDELRTVLDLAVAVSRGPSTDHDLAHIRSYVGDPLHVVAWIDGAPAGFAYSGIWPGAEEDEHMHADGGVLPALRGRGVGTALLGRLSEHARSLGKSGLQFEVGEDDPASLAYLARRGYVEAERQMQVALDLTAVDGPPPEPPEGIRIVTREERGDLLDGMYEVSAEAQRDVPGLEGDQTWSFDEWKAWEVDRPSTRPELCFIALDGDRVAGYAVLQAFDDAIYQGFTAVGRAWRRRGVGRALTQRQIAAAKAAGYEKLFCESEERNVPMRKLCESLGYQPLPAMIVLQGPLTDS
jgi:GNAT superfamily N-acetyltransferase